jgi:hypothetical protein
MRTLATYISNAIDTRTIKVCHLVDIDWASGQAFFTDGGRNIVWNGNTYINTAGLGEVGAVQESVKLEAPKLDLKLSQVNTINLQKTLSEFYQGRSAKVHLAFFNEAEQLQDVVSIFIGRVDDVDFTLGMDGEIRLSIISEMDDWNRSKIRRYNNSDQQTEFAGDRFFEYTEQIAQGLELKVVL